MVLLAGQPIKIMNLQESIYYIFRNDAFYKEIESITIDGVELEQKDEGALWMVPITSIPKYALIGVVTNHDVTITLKDGKTLTDLGLADKAVSFGSVWIQNDGTIASESISNGYILEEQSEYQKRKGSRFYSRSNDPKGNV